MVKSEQRGHALAACVAAALLVLGAAVLLRLPWLGTTHYASGDEVLWGLQARNLAAHPLLLLNPSAAMVPPEELTPATRYPLFVRSSAYPVLIAVPIALLGPDHFSLRIVNCLFGIALVPLVFWVGRMTLGRAQGVAAALALATLPAAVMFSRMAYNESVVAALALAALGIAYRKDKLGGPRQAALVGLLVGYAYLVKAIEVMVIALPALAILLLWRREPRLWRWTAVALGVAAAVVLLPIAVKALLTPWALPNALRTLGFNYGVPWRQPFDFYFLYLVGEFSLLLPFIACGVLGVLRRSTQTGADRRALVWLVIALMVLPMSIPQVKKDTYSLMLMPALALLAGEGIVFASRLREQGRGWAAAGGAALLALPLLALALGWAPQSNHGSFLMAGQRFMDHWWPLALGAVLIANAVLVAAALWGRLRKIFPPAVAAGALAAAVALVSGGVTWFGIAQGQRDLVELNRYRNDDWQCAALASLQDEIRRAWPGRDLLVGVRAHANDVAYHGATRRRVRYLDLRRERQLESTLARIEGHRYPFIADSLRPRLTRFGKNPGLGERMSPLARRTYEAILERYKDVTDWFRNRYGLEASVRVYCLRHVDPTVLDLY